MPESPAGTRRGAGDLLPDDCSLIEVRVATVRQLFNAMDPSPFREKDLDPNAEEFIVSWAREMPADRPIGLLIHLDAAARGAEEAELVREAVHEFFRDRARAARRQVRQLLRIGRISLAIGLTCLATSIVAGDAAATAFGGTGLGALLGESLLIGGWVAMWRPLEIFLYDWWPIRAEGRLFDRLAEALVRITYTA